MKRFRLTWVDGYGISRKRVLRTRTVLNEVVDLFNEHDIAHEVQVLR